ncbi:MAG: flippase-like domain-containing protein [Lentisphaeria bacterium]|nr:flippase-like domain-containing protein [Lentisphaeria bacterium]
MKTWLKTLVKLLLAAGIIAVLVYKTPAGFLDTLLAADRRWIAAALVLYGIHIFANGWRWWLLLRAQKIDCSLWTACSLTMQSFFFSLVLPGGAIGGDLVRVGFLTSRIQKGRRFDGGFTILIDRFTGMIGIFALALGMMPFVWSTIASVKGVMEQFVYVLLAGSFVGIAASVVVFNHRMLEKISLYRKLSAFGDRITRGTYSKITAALDSYAECRMEIAVCIVASIVLVNLVLGVEAWCVAAAVTGEIPSFGVVLAAITIGNIAGLLPTTPSGVGTRDLFVIPILQAGGMSYDSALAVSLTITAIIVLYNLAGGLFFIFDPAKKKENADDRQTAEK